MVLCIYFFIGKYYLIIYLEKNLQKFFGLNVQINLKNTTNILYTKK